MSTVPILEPNLSSRAMLCTLSISQLVGVKLAATPFRQQTIVQKRTGAPIAGQFFLAVTQHLSTESVV